MIRLGREVRSRTDYILGTDHRLFRNVAIQDPWHNSDHHLVLVCLHSAPLREHTEYLGRRTRLPLWPLITPTREDGLFMDLRRSIPKSKTQEVRKNGWILADTWRLFNKRVSARWDPAREQAHIRRLGCAINAILREERQ